MNQATADSQTLASFTEIAEAYDLELQAVKNHLGAETSDLLQLMRVIPVLEVSRHQIQELLESSWCRLQTLRSDIAGLAAQPVCDDIDSEIKLADLALQTGDGFSPGDADDACERAYRFCLDQSDYSAIGVRIRAAQALIAIIGLNFRHAIALYAEAAAFEDIEPSLQWRYLQQQALALENLGREFIDIEALQAAVELYQQTLLPLTSAQERPADRAEIMDSLGNVLGTLGQRHRGTRMLERAISTFEDALTLRPREQMPSEWATTQNHLGNALGALAQRQHDEEMLEQSIAAFEAALEVRTREDVPEAWASTQNNLAAVLLSLGQQRKDSKILKRAVDGYKSVLTVWTRDRLPLVWSTTMDNLGTALRLLGNHRKGPRTLEQSVAAYNAALSIRTRQRLPHHWAMTQNNLGAALQMLGERNDDPVTLGKSVVAYRESIKELNRESESMSWAMTMANLGVARRKLAECSADIDISRRASADIKMAVDVFRGASHAQLTELGEEQLAISRKLTIALEAAAVE